jgi:hypothetical protein
VWDLASSISLSCFLTKALLSPWYRFSDSLAFSRVASHVLIDISFAASISLYQDRDERILHQVRSR